MKYGCINSEAFCFS